jgi:hypothetical protein
VLESVTKVLAVTQVLKSVSEMLKTAPKVLAAVEVLILVLATILYRLQLP